MRSSTRKAHSKPGSTRIIGGHGSRATDNSADFHATFSAQFLQRYAELFQALAAPVQHVALLNSFTTVNDCEELGLVDKVCQSGPITCLRYPEQVTSYPPPPSCPYTQLKQFYYMDFASVLPPLLLGVQPHHVVLDMCAAPGGKSLVLAMQLLLGQQQQQQQQHAAVGEGGDAEAAAVGESQQQGVLMAGLLQQLHISSEQQPQEADAPAAGAADSTEELSPEQQQHQGPEAAAELTTAATEGAAASSSAQQPQQEPPSASGWATAAAAGDGSSSTAGSLGGEGHDDNEEEEPAAAAGAGGRSASSAGRLVCNELDPVRRQRLSGVLSGFIPGSLRRRVRLMGQDAAKHWARFEGGLYDRVLLDAPCTSERHVVAAALEAGGVVSSSSWSREQCSSMAALQLKLLLAGLRALKPGGRLVYSTCSIAKVENDDVVQQALQQSSGSVVVVPVKDWDMLQLAGGEPTQHGMICLPDQAGWGPIYLCLLEKQL